MRDETLLLLAVFVPVLGSFLVPVAGQVSSKLRNGLALACVAASFISSCALIPSAASGKCGTFAMRFPIGV